MSSPLSKKVVLFVAIIIVTLQANSAINSISSDSYNINVVSNYTWNIAFNTSTSRGTVNLTFPSTCVLSGSTSASIGGTTVPSTFSSNVLTVTSSLLLSTITIVVKNVQNPNAAYSYSSQFIVSSGLDGSISYGGLIKYNSGTLASSSWSFSLCTEQPNSVLTITVVTTNTVPVGSNKFEVSYGAWANHYNKNLLTGVTSLATQVSINGAANTTVTNTFDTTIQKITITYTLSSILPSASTLVFIISGVQSPPTQTTPTSSSYKVATTDINGFTIDQATSCPIASVCVYTLTTGTFSNSYMPVNSLYSSNPSIMYSETPIITFQNSDTIQLYFTPLANLNTCNTLNFWRNISNNAMQATLTQTSTFYQYTLPASMTPNTDYSVNITLNLNCTSITIPSSETPVLMTFKFKRNGAQYLQLSATMTPTATSIASVNANTYLTNYQMTKSSVNYTLSILTAQPLGTSPSLKFYFTSDITIASPVCSVSLITGTVSAMTCQINATTNVLTVNFTALTAVTSSTNISVAISGFTNPSSPNTDNFGIETFYDSSISTSRVEYNFNAFTATFVGITNYPATFSPTSLTVYTSTSTTISFTNSIVIPSGSTIYVQFPSAASSITLSSAPLSVSGATSSAVATNYGNNSFIVTTSADIPVNSPLVISSTIVTPSTMGSFNYIVLRVQKGSTVYMESATSMYLYVNTVVSLPIGLTAVNSIAGATSGYTISMTLSVPHPSSFYVQVDLPGDVGYTSSAASCSGNCSSSITGTSNFTSFIITATNSQPTQTNQVVTFNLAAAFTNARSVGTSLPWNFTTKTITPTNTITFSSSAPTINNPNSLTISMLSDSYYKNNTNPVKISFGFTNNLMSGDYIQMRFNTLTYSEYTTVNCSLIFGTCSKSSASTSGLLVINIVPNLSSITSKTLSLTLEGVISGSNIVDSVPVSSYTNAGNLIDTGYMQYQLSCKDSATVTILNNCRTCYTNKSCIDCYTSLGFYLNASACVSSCGVATSYLSYDNSASGVCTGCLNNCYTCTSATSCLSCVTGYFYLSSNNSCLATCSAAGYVQANVSGVLYCSQCYGNGSCLQCSSSAPGACTLCDTSSVLSNGLCSSSCSNSSMYASGGVCYGCDASCTTCNSGGNGGCLKCALNYYNYSNFCLSTCPNDTAASSTGYCTCDSPCSKCQGTTTNCTACINSSLFVSNGSCLSSCPSASYLTGSTCMPCSTACVSCTSTTCLSCISTSYLYNNICYSDCNLIGQQYDASGTTCVMCPDGCDTCTRATCYSCLSNYTLSSSTSQCVKTCLLTNSCDISGQQVIPLPGLISLFIWTVIVIIIKLVMHKSYVPYSLILASSVIEFVLVIATLANSTDISGYSFRLLTTSSAERMTIRGLLGGALAINYISNIIYIVLFVKYIKPLISNPRQIDVIANVVVIVFGTLTNYRFAVIAFSKMFPKPSIYVQNQSKLTPVHYLTIGSLVLDIIPLAACIIALLNQQPLTNLFMLAIDLLIVIVVNIFITIWFVSCKKPDQYFQSEIKKNHTYEDHNNTHQNIEHGLENEKNLSKANMANNQTFHFVEEDYVSNKNDEYSANYKKIDNKTLKNSIKTAKQSESIIKKVSPSAISKNQEGSQESDLNLDISEISVKGKQKQRGSEFSSKQDVNFEEGLKSKHGSSSAAKIPSREKVNFNETLKSEGKSVEDGLSAKKKSQTDNFSKQVTSARKNYIRPQRDIQEVQEQGDVGDVAESSNNQSIFDRQKQKLSKPHRVGEKRPTKQKKAQKSKEPQQPMRIMKKQNKIGYFDTDAFESNAEEDIESIIKQKVWQSAVKKDKHKDTDNQLPQNSNSETEYEEISPSWFDKENQRMDLSDFGENDSEP